MSPCISSISREPIEFSVAPTDWNSIDLLTAWNIIRNTAAQIVSSTPIPAHPTINPRLATVESASTFLASLCEIAMTLAAMNVNPPMHDTRSPVRFPLSAGDILISR